MPTSPTPINQAAVVFSQLVRDFKSLGHPSEEAIALAEAMVHIFAEYGSKIFAMAEAVKQRKAETSPDHA